MRIPLLIATVVGAMALTGCHRPEAAPVFAAAAERELAGFAGTAPPTTADYASLFAYFVEGWETYRRPEGAAADLPGLPSRHGKSVDALEAFARTAPLVASWLRSGRPTHVMISGGRSIDLIEMIARGVRAGTDRNSPGYWGDIHDLDQRIVEASDVALALWLSRDVVWAHFTAAERQRALAWLSQVNGRRVPDNNWHLFIPFVNAVSGALGGNVDRAGSLANYQRFKSFYRGNGWFSDGPKGAFDYYNAWAIHYQLFWLHEVDPTWDPGFIESAEHEFLNNYRYLMGPAGLPMLGRSICYRMAAPAPLVFGSVRHPDWISPADARRALDAVWGYFIGKGAVRNGTVTQGYCGADPRIVDNYSGPASCLWALRSLVPAFYVGEADGFWREPPGKLVVDTADYRISIPAIGWTVVGTRESGTVRIIQRDSLPSSRTSVEDYGVVRRLATALLWRPFRPDNRDAKYGRGEYASDRPFCGCR